MRRARSSNVLPDLIQRTKNAVRELENLEYHRAKKILMVDENSEDTPSRGVPAAGNSSSHMAGDDSVVSSFAV